MTCFSRQARLAEHLVHGEPLFGNSLVTGNKTEKTSGIQSGVVHVADTGPELSERAAAKSRDLVAVVAKSLTGCESTASTAGFPRAGLALATYVFVEPDDSALPG